MDLRKPGIERRKRQAGLSLVEVMVGMVILGIVSSQALGMLQSQLHTYHSQSRVLDVQEDSRAVADMILADIRMAGFMIPAIAGISSVDGGANAADSLCVSEWTLMDDTELSNATSRFGGAGLNADMFASSSVDLTASEMDIDGDGDDDFLVDSGIIVSDGTESHCGRITAVAGSLVSFTPAAPAGFSALVADSRAVPAIVYQFNAAGALTRNDLVLSTQVEDLQVQYDIDDDDDGLIAAGTEDRFDSLNAHDHTLIKQVRLFVLTRTSSEDLKLTGIGRQGVANRNAAATADDFRRRLVSVTASPRNL